MLQNNAVHAIPVPDYKSMVSHLKTRQAWETANVRVDTLTQHYAQDPKRRVSQTVLHPSTSFKSLFTNPAEAAGIAPKAFTMYVDPNNPADRVFFEKHFTPNWYWKVGGYYPDLPRILDAGAKYNPQYMATFISPNEGEIIPVSAARGMAISLEQGITPGFSQIFPVYTSEVTNNPGLLTWQHNQAKDLIRQLTGRADNVMLGEIGALYGTLEMGEGRALQPRILGHIRRQQAQVYTGTFSQLNAKSCIVAVNQGFQGVVLPWNIGFATLHGGEHTIFTSRMYVDLADPDPIRQAQNVRIYENMLKLPGAIPFEQFDAQQGQFYQEAGELIKTTLKGKEGTIFGHTARVIQRGLDGAFRFERFTQAVFDRYPKNKLGTWALALITGASLLKDKLFTKQAA